MPPLTPMPALINTPAFAAFVRGARGYLELTQEQVAERGGPRRQLQGWIENGDRSELTEGVLTQYDRAFSWPLGYLAAVAQLSAFTTDGLAAPTAQDHPGDASSPTLAALYAANRYKAPVPIGYEPTTGLAVYGGPPLLTNIPFAHLRAIAAGRAGPTLIDTTITDDASLSAIVGGSTTRETRPRLYRTCPLPASVSDGCHPIAVDPLSDITDITEARRLARTLMDYRPHIDTTVERAAFTFLAIAAFGHNPFITMNHYLSGGPLRDTFLEFWGDFYNADQVGYQLAQPDSAACYLLDGLIAARDSVTDIAIGAFREGDQRTPRYTAAALRRSLTITESREDAIVFFDGSISPEVPACINHLSFGSALSFYSAKATPSSAGGDVPRPVLTPTPDLWLMHRSIGIAEQLHDLDVIAQYRPERIETLTNFVNRYAVHCGPHRARVVWIPEN